MVWAMRRSATSLGVGVSSPFRSRRSNNSVVYLDAIQKIYIYFSLEEDRGREEGRGKRERERERRKEGRKGDTFEES